jgi:hypothetical protein
MDFIGLVHLIMVLAGVDGRKSAAALAAEVRTHPSLVL